MTHKNRGRIYCAPITNRWDHQALIALLPRTQYEPVALIVGYEGGTVAEGVLVRAKATGTLAKLIGQSIESIDPRKAWAALDAMTGFEP